MSVPAKSSASKPSNADKLPKKAQAKKGIRYNLKELILNLVIILNCPKNKPIIALT